MTNETLSAEGRAREMLKSTLPPLDQKWFDECPPFRIRTERAIAALTTALERVERLEEALIKCRDRFAEYAASHRAKAENAGRWANDDESIARSEKAARNQEMVDLINAALASRVPVASPTSTSHFEKQWSDLCATFVRELMDMLPKRPRCRDCADKGPRCALDDRPCDPFDEIRELMTAALKHREPTL